MTQPITAILSHQSALVARARLQTGDLNEAGLLVGAVMSKAFARAKRPAEQDLDLSAAIWRDLDELLLKRRAS